MESLWLRDEGGARVGKSVGSSSTLKGGTIRRWDPSRSRDEGVNINSQRAYFSRALISALNRVGSIVQLSHNNRKQTIIGAEEDFNIYCFTFWFVQKKNIYCFTIKSQCYTRNNRT
jgi:hypothetical protein